MAEELARAKTIAVSTRGSTSPRSAIRKLAADAEAAAARGLTVYALNIGQPDIETPGVLFDALRSLDLKVLAYGPSRGIPHYVEALAEYYRAHDLAVTAEDVVVTVGGSEALVFALLLTCDAGDEVIVPEPFYTNYASFAHQAGVRLVPLTTVAEDGFHLPPRPGIEALVGPRTRAILFSNPANPTGTVYTAEELRAVADLAAARGLFVIADEVYRDFVFDGRRHVSMLELDAVADRVIMVDSTSKRFSACGARVGALVSRNRELVEGALRLAEARLCAPTLGQLVGEVTLRESAAYLREVRAEYVRRRDVVYERIAALPGAVCSRPEGAFYAQVKLPIDDADRFARWLLTDFEHDGATVFVAPGSGFYVTPGRGADEVRIAYVLRERQLAQALDVLAAGVEAYPGRRR